MPSHFLKEHPKYIIPFLLISKTSHRANMERLLLLLICFLLLSQPNNCSSSLSFNSSTPLCHSHQSSTLLHFRNSFSIGVSRLICEYYSYPLKNSWKMGTDCCGWDGVTCDTMTGHVIAVDLSCSRLEGRIHPNTTLFSLRHLQRLNLAYNDFNDSTISSKFDGFANMTHLNLTDSSVAGNFPSEISHLSKLFSLDLSWNYDMRIEIPSLKRLVQNLTHLTELVLCKVEFNQPFCWLYSVQNLLVFQHLVTLYLGGFVVRVVNEIEC